MTDTLAAVLDLLLPGLDPRLLPPEALAWIRPLSEGLPPGRLGGFEVRLHPASSRVDFQVAWRRDEAEALASSAAWGHLKIGPGGVVKAYLGFTSYLLDARGKESVQPAS